MNSHPVAARQVGAADSVAKGRPEAVVGQYAGWMLQSTTTPLMLLLMGIYVVTFSADGVLERVPSFVPVASIVSMPVRVLSGDAQWWEPVVSLLLLIAFAVGAVLVSERACRGALLQTGGRLTWRQALRAEA
jgi:ABC-2 type transport system permease protein